MQLLKPTDTPADSPLEGQLRALRDRMSGAFDAARRGLLERVRGASAAVRRTIRANSLVRIHRGRISVGIHVEDIDFGRLEPADVGG